MNRAHQYVNTLLENLPLHELGSTENREVFEKIRERLTNASDLGAELKTLYRVNSFSQFALSLLWIADQVERNPALLEPRPEDETLVLSAFQNAVMEGSEAVETPQAESAEAQPAGFEETPGAEMAPLFEQGAVSEMAGSTDDRDQQFAALLERFVEAVQSGSDDRGPLLDELLGVCSQAAAPESGAADDFRELAQLLSEFLQYISENQYLDDVRVMNITSNITDPVLQWAKALPEERAGLLESGSSMLRDFRSLFE